MTERLTRPESTASLIGVLLAVAMPMAGLGLLLGWPGLDLTWEHHPSHFWLVLLSAALSAVLAYATSESAVRRGDARVLFVSLTFLSSAGFLGLHALATPGVLLHAPNPGFVVATPVGVAVGSIFAALSSVDITSDRVVRAVQFGRAMRLVLVTAMLLWAAAALVGLPPLSGSAESAGGWSAVIAAPAIALYGYSALRYVNLWRRRHQSLMLLAMLSAFVLLAEALVAITFARDWHLTWWEWHVLLLVAFGLVAWGARRSWHEERFADLYLADTVAGNRDMSVLFADLEGFTSFSESHEPSEVTEMLNEYFAVTVPAVVAVHGGDVDRIIGDALMVTFNKRGDQPDHAIRAARAGLELQAAAKAVADAHPGWPRFRVGINSGPVTVSVLGTGGGRTHTVIGDTVNTASRIEGKAPAGGVAIGSSTKALLPQALTEPLGDLALKGKKEPVEAHLLIDVTPHRRG